MAAQTKGVAAERHHAMCGGAGQCWPIIPLPEHLKAMYIAVVWCGVLRWLSLQAANFEACQPDRPALAAEIVHICCDKHKLNNAALVLITGTQTAR